MLQTKNLTIGYPNKYVAKHINLAIPKNSLVCVIGENGSGKSTLLKTLCKTLQPINGTVTLDGIDIQTINQTTLAKQISLVLTESLIQSQFTVFEIVALGRQPYTNWIDTLTDTDKSIIHQALVATNTIDLAAQKFSELSDGQQQRVFIARALAQDTPLIILDEPTAHLDLHQTIQIFKLLKNLSSTKEKTIILSTHNINLGLKFADYLAILKDQTVTFGSKNQLIEGEVFETIFPTNFILFDKTLQQFIINND